jgi:hypothetical protein
MILEKNIPIPPDPQPRVRDWTLVDSMEVGDCVFYKGQDPEIWKRMKWNGWQQKSKQVWIEGQLHVRTWRIA